MESNFESAQTGTNAPAPGGASIWSIMIGVFTSPTQAFDNYKKSPSIIIPLVVVLVLGAVVAGLMTGPNASMQYDLMKNSTVLPAQALEQMKADAENPKMIMGVIFAPVMIVVFSVLGALVAWFLGSFVFGGTAKFKAIWGAGLLGSLIMQLGALVRAPLAIAQDSGYVTLGLAAFFPDKDFTSIFYSLLFYLDGFMIWSLIITGFGYAAVLGISRGKGIAVSVITGLLFILGAIGMMAFGMSFAGVEMSFF
ncbi:MAG: hypothetical protein GY841_02395 [FCB group bacterium]|nr:hypothetical protein [FCB group bacterium]